MAYTLTAQMLTTGSRLRLVPTTHQVAKDRGRRRVRERNTNEAAKRPILIVGADADKRKSVVDEMSRSMSPGTAFEHARTSWEVVDRAASSQMVVLSGDLTDVTAPTLLRMLAHRHPALPVVRIGEPQAFGA